MRSWSAAAMPGPVSVDRKHQAAAFALPPRRDGSSSGAMSRSVRVRLREYRRDREGAHCQGRRAQGAAQQVQGEQRGHRAEHQMTARCTSSRPPT